MLHQLLRPAVPNPAPRPLRRRAGRWPDGSLHVCARPGVGRAADDSSESVARSRRREGCAGRPHRGARAQGRAADRGARAHTLRHRGARDEAREHLGTRSRGVEGLRPQSRPLDRRLRRGLLHRGGEGQA